MNSLTTWNRVIFEKLKSLSPSVRNNSASYGMRKAHYHLKCPLQDSILNHMNPAQTLTPSFLISYFCMYMPGYSKVSLSVFWDFAFLSFPYACYIPNPCHPLWYDGSNIWWLIRVTVQSKVCTVLCPILHGHWVCGLKSCFGNGCLCFFSVWVALYR